MSTYLKDKLSRTNNADQIKRFFIACKTLREDIFNAIYNPAHPIDIQDNQACTLSLAVIACTWLPIQDSIENPQTFITEVKRLFPKRKKSQLYTHQLFEHLHKYLNILNTEKRKANVWRSIQQFRAVTYHLKEEYFGRAYEEIRKYMPQEPSLDDNFTRQGNVHFVQNPSRKKHGQYYTPEDITEFMTERNVVRWMQSHNIETFDKDNLPILVDLTVGAGAFLLSAVRHIERKWENFTNLSLQQKLENRQYIVQHCMYGLDLDSEALKVCQFSLWLMSVGENTSYHPNLTSNFRHRDLLQELRAIKKSHKGNWSNKFDIVIGNPPYVNLPQKTDAYQTAKELDLVTIECRNLYAYTIELCLKCQKDTGVLGLIVPLSLCIGSGFSSLRKLLLEQNSWLETLNFDVVPGYLFNQGKIEGTSKEAITQRCTIISLNRTKDLKIITTERIRWTDGTDRPDLFNYINLGIIEKTIIPLSVWSKEKIIEEGIPLLGMNTLIRKSKGK